MFLFEFSHTSAVARRPVECPPVYPNAPPRPRPHPASFDVVFFYSEKMVFLKFVDEYLVVRGIFSQYLVIFSQYLVMHLVPVTRKSRFPMEMQLPGSCV